MFISISINDSIFKSTGCNETEILRCFSAMKKILSLFIMAKFTLFDAKFTPKIQVYLRDSREIGLKL